MTFIFSNKFESPFDSPGLRKTLWRRFKQTRWSIYLKCSDDNFLFSLYGKPANEHVSSDSRWVITADFSMKIGDVSRTYQKVDFYLTCKPDFLQGFSFIVKKANSTLETLKIIKDNAVSVHVKLSNIKIGTRPSIMNFSFCHKFKDSIDSEQCSDWNICEKTKWCFRVHKDREKIRFGLFGKPLDGLERPGMPWNITVDYEVTIGDLLYYKEQKFFRRDTAYSERSNQAFFLIGDATEASNDPRIVKNEEILVEVKLSNITVNRIRNFEMIDFQNTTLTSSPDFTISIGTIKFHCHSQILASRSLGFKRIMGNLIKEKQLEIVLDEGISIDDFGEFLHQIYFPLETIDGLNMNFLLHLGRKYDVSQIVFACQKYLSDCFEREMTKKQMKRLFLIVWRYDLSMLKWDWLMALFPSVTIEMITDLMEEENYQLMHENNKLELLDILTFKLTFLTCVV